MAEPGGGTAQIQLDGDPGAGKSWRVKATLVREMGAGAKAVVVASCDGSRYSRSTILRVLGDRVARAAK